MDHLELIGFGRKTIEVKHHFSSYIKGIYYQHDDLF